MNVGIIGLGLIGGSMAKSIKSHTSHTVFGIDTDRETISLARLCSAIDAPLTDENLGSCTLVLVALRPNAAAEWVKAHGEMISKKTIVVDLCGVKRSVVGAIAPIAEKHGFYYVGGHPMAGNEGSGFLSSEADMFVGTSMILTPDARTNITQLEFLKNFFSEIGFAKLTFSTPEDHDRIIAYTSQLAHIVSSAYIKSPEAKLRGGFSAGSFQDMTRVAQLNENMWTELFLNDADYLAAQLETLIDNLTGYLEAIKARDTARLNALLKEGSEKKAAVGE